MVLGGAIILAVLIACCTTGPAGGQQTPAATTATPVRTSPVPMVTTAPPSPTPTGEVTVPGTTLASTPVPTVNMTPTPPPVVAITIQNGSFNPKTVTIPAGTMVTWTNLEAFPHTISSSVTPKFGPGKIFLSNSLEKGDTFSFTFTNAGVYQYYAVDRHSMLGTITVI